MATRPTSKYEADNGDIHKITASAETIAAAGTPPAGAVTTDIIAKITKSNREYGIRPRKVRLSRVVGTAPDDFRVYKDLPVLTPTDFAAPGFAIGGTITIDGVVWVIIGRQGEDF